MGIPVLTFRDDARSRSNATWRAGTHVFQPNGSSGCLSPCETEANNCSAMIPPDEIIIQDQIRPSKSNSFHIRSTRSPDIQLRPSRASWQVRNHHFWSDLSSRPIDTRADRLKHRPDVIDDLCQAHALDFGSLGIGQPLCGLHRVGGERPGQARRSLSRHLRLTPLKGLFDTGPQVVLIETDGLRQRP